MCREYFSKIHTYDKVITYFNLFNVHLLCHIKSKSVRLFLACTKCAHTQALFVQVQK